MLWKLLLHLITTRYESQVSDAVGIAFRNTGHTSVKQMAFSAECVTGGVEEVLRKAGTGFRDSTLQWLDPSHMEFWWGLKQFISKGLFRNLYKVIGW